VPCVSSSKGEALSFLPASGLAQTYDRAVGRHGGACTDWQVHAVSYEDCVMNASVREGGIAILQAPGPYCIALNTGGDVNFGACR